MLSELEQSLQVLVPSEALAMMVDGEDPLRLRGILQTQLGEAIKNIRDCLRAQDVDGTTEQIRRDQPQAKGLRSIRWPMECA